MQKMSAKIPQKIYDCLKEVVKDGLSNYEIKMHDSNKKGEGFLGEMLYVTLQDKISNATLDMIVKQAFSDPKIRTESPIRKIYLNEIYFYKEIWTKLNKFQDRIPTQYQFQKVPKCLGVFTEENSEKIILENLKMQGFETHDKTIPLDGKHYEYIMKEYGKLHALSLAYKTLYPEDYDNLVKNLADIYTEILSTDGFRKTISLGAKVCVNSLRPGEDDDVIKKYKIFAENALEEFEESCDCKTKYTVITHGDCWSNNLMFKYDDQGEIIDMKFLDFQLSKVGSPCCDLSYSIYSGASFDVLQDFDKYLQIYYDSLSDCLRAFGCDPGLVFPMQDLKNDWKKYCKLGFFMAIGIWRLKTTYEGQIKDLTDMSDDKEYIDTFYEIGYDKELFKNITRNIILHLYKHDFL